jgi:hypothetical protein
MNASGNTAPVKVPGQPLTCRAHSSQSGLPCRNPAIDGGRVCAVHGGSTKQAKRVAQKRLDAFLDEAVSSITELSLQREHYPTAFAATKEVPKAKY